MDITVVAGLGGLGFVLFGLAMNGVYHRAGVPAPGSGMALDAVAASFAKVGDALRRPSVVAPVLWAGTTLFAAGLLAVFLRAGGTAEAWAFAGFAGVLMQNATFTCVEALRFALAAAARERAPVGGLWGLSNVLFGFNQVFLALALLGFTAAGVSAGLIPAWHAVLGYASAALLFVSSLGASHTAAGRARLGPVGLAGWLGWAAWIVVYSVMLIGR